MLRCRDVTELASDLLEGGLPLRARLVLRLHLALCSMCRAYVDQLRKTRALLGRSRFSPPDPATEDALIARMTGRGDD
ncbi:MAG: zf-HC2 domain-containing protein [Acetobacteraceae bacterium]|nr:zf-HC2 domain-containing protein [Acetobacteraceae bacterium]